MKLRRIAAGMLGLALASACSTSPVREPLVNVPAPKPLGVPMHCLAVSGGGIRSGAVSLGVIQELYARELLREYELISTVSGGGYPVYGLLDTMIRYNIPLRELLEENGPYIAAVERNPGIVKIGPTLLSELLLQPLGVPLSWVGRPYASAQPGYIAAIHETFTGKPLPRFRLPTLSHARDIRDVHGFPIPVFGTAASRGPAPPRPDDDGDHDYSYGDFFELSPFGSGSPNFGDYPDLAREVGLGQAIAMSAAALDTPQGKLQIPGFLKAINMGFGGSFDTINASGERQRFFLSDGGFIENLSLLPLLRRGCTDIVAFENSDDSDEPFDAWFDFAERLSQQEAGWRISVPLQSEAGEILDRESAKRLNRWEMPGHIWDAQLARGDHRVHVRLVKLGIATPALNAYPKHVRKYIGENWRGDKPECRETLLGRRCPFPLETTLRQRYEPEEFRAYRHLGRWLARRATCLSPPAFEREHENLTADVDDRAVVQPRGLRDRCARAAGAAASGAAAF